MPLPTRHPQEAAGPLAEVNDFGVSAAMKAMAAQSSTVLESQLSALDAKAQAAAAKQEMEENTIAAWEVKQPDVLGQLQIPGQQRGNLPLELPRPTPPCPWWLLQLLQWIRWLLQLLRSGFQAETPQGLRRGPLQAQAVAAFAFPGASQACDCIHCMATASMLCCGPTACCLLLVAG